MKIFNKVADRMLSLLVPTTTAQAGPCACSGNVTIGYVYCACVNGTLKYKRKWCDGCNIRYDACKTVDFC